MIYFATRMSIATLAIALTGCASATPKAMPTTSETIPVHLEQFPSRGIYIRGFDRDYFGADGITVPKGTAVKLRFLIANGLDDDIFLEYNDHLAQITMAEFGDEWEGGGGVIDLNLLMTSANYKNIRGAYQFIHNGRLIDDGFVLASVVLPDHSHGKQCDGELDVDFRVNFCVRRTGKWYSLWPTARVHVHYR